jgi:hypothetical protein
MANRKVTYTIQTITEGKKEIQEVAKEADNLKQSEENATEQGKKLNKELINLNQLSQAFGNFQSAFSGLGNLIGNFNKDLQTQVAAEARLEQAMRNTMNASNEQIQSIKDLASAQQKLGVIGDEVILTGAQELATYLSKTESLKQLIPVLNDITAQQYGFNASAEASQQIATMIGKVMEGQTAALSRYGYSFSEAEKHILETGNEMQRAATLADVVTRSVGGINQALANTPQGAFTQLNNSIGDFKEKIGAALQPLQVFFASFGEAVLVASQISQCVIAFNTLRNTINLATVAQTALNFAMNANPVGIVISAIGLLVAGLVALYNKSDAFRNMCNQVWEVMKTLGQIVFNMAIAPFKSLLTILKPLFDWLKNIANVIKNFVIAGFNALSAACQTVVSLLKKIFNISDSNSADNAEKLADNIDKAADATDNLNEITTESIEINKKVAEQIELVSGQYGYEQKQIQKLQKLLETASVDEAIMLKTKIYQLQQIIALREKEINLALIDTTGKTPDNQPLKTASINNLNTPDAPKIPDTFLSKDSLNQLNQLNKQTISATDNINALGTAFDSLSNSIGGAAGQWLKWGANLAQAISKAIPQITALTAAENVKASAAGKSAAMEAGASVASVPYAGPILAIAAIAAVVSALLAIPKFAKGGIVYGPTLGLMGEYQNAATNPEVIAPLSRLQDIFENGKQAGQTVSFFIDGRNLRGVLDKNINYNRQCF